jgi:LPS-assembly protein
MMTFMRSGLRFTATALEAALLGAAASAFAQVATTPQPPPAATTVITAPDGAAPPPEVAQQAAVEARVCPAPAGASLTAPRSAAAEPTRPDPSAPIDVSSDEARLGVQGDAVLSGNVRVRQGDREIRADSVEYDAGRNAFRVRGKVEYRDPIVRATGGSGEYSGADGARFEGAQFELPQRPARGSARDMRLDTSGRVTLEDVTFSTCPADDVDWLIRAKRIELDTRSRNGTGRDASVEFLGVPILYLPYISFPLGTERKSGFLFPSVGYTSRSGAQVSVPYYWNISPPLDLTFQPTLYSSRGLNLAAEFRYLSVANRGIAEVDVLPSDRVEDLDRHWARWLHTTGLPADWRLTIEAQDVSDPGYFEDFAQGAEGTSTAFLERIARVSYRDEFWRIHGYFQEFQTISEDLPRDERPYASVPRLLASGSTLLGRSAVRAALDAELVNFHRSVGTTGWRLDAEPSLSLDLTRPGYYLRPTAGYRYTRYDLEDTLPGEQTSPQRSMPFASFDAGLLLERRAGRDGGRRITLEPRALYLYTPFRDQSRLPVFDTGIPDLNLVQLFRNNRYVGADRVGDANQVSLGLQSALFDAPSGARFVSAAIGQTYYFETPKVLLPGEPPRRRGASDLIAQLGLTAYRHWNVDLGVQWNPDQTREERAQARVQYRPAPDRVANLIYRSQRDRLQQAEASAAWPVGERWNVFGRWIYDLQASQSNDRFVGIEYKACCWRLRAVGRRFVSTRTGEQDTGVYVQLELNGLSSVGSAADSFLEGAVRGYSRSAVSP